MSEPRPTIAATTLVAVALVLTTSGCALRTREVTGAALTVPAAPAATAAAGRLVGAVPGVVPVPPDSRVTASAVEPRGDLLGVSVTGTTTRTVPQLLAFFRARLTAAGFTSSGDGLLPPGASGAAYGRGREFLLVAVVDHGPDRSWSVGGTVTP